MVYTNHCPVELKYDADSWFCMSAQSFRKDFSPCHDKSRAAFPKVMIATSCLNGTLPFYIAQRFFSHDTKIERSLAYLEMVPILPK